jgi:outer membrane biosynthesis protein TonB
MSVFATSSTAKASGDGADSAFLTSVTSSEYEPFIAFDQAQGWETGTLQLDHQPRYKDLGLLLFVFIAHTCLFLLICILWRPQLNPFGLTETESRGPKVAALKAYFIYAPAVEKAESAALETEIKAEDKTEAASSVTSTTVPTPTTPIKPQPTLKKVMPETAVSEKVEAEKVEQEKVKPDTVKPDITQSSQSQSSAQSEVQPAEVTAKKPTNTLDTTEIKPQLGAQSSPAAEGESSIATSSSMSLFTQQYFERQREQALDDLVIEQADKFTRKSNMSEMSPEMEVLFVPNADDFGGTTSLDLPLDPNRIVRKGDTCYRVVQVGTQVNPYAENLGFPFDCSGKKINQAIDDAIQSRLNKMMLKPHK